MRQFLHSTTSHYALAASHSGLSAPAGFDWVRAWVLFEVQNDLELF